jgi:thiol:disulfide interchange protein DsbD
MIHFLSLSTISATAAIPCTFNDTIIDDTTHELSVTCNLSPQEYIYKDSLAFSLDNQDIQLQPWQSATPATTIFDTISQERVDVFQGPVTFTIIAHKNKHNNNPAQLYMRYIREKNKPEEHFFDIASNEEAQITEEKPTQRITCPNRSYQPTSLVKLFKENITHVISYITNALTLLKKQLSQAIETTQHPAVRFLTAFLLGIMMSLTPCIYPMIPITVGILQTSSGSSIAKNFLLALSYTMGIATTFALLGLLAASGSAQFGLLLGNPTFVLLLCSFLLYLAGSMLGIYEMYIPRFMQPKNHTVRQGSYISAFIFGAISGSVASPCLSPGLLLLLSVVATLGNKLLGFSLLYCFGLGLGMPLLLIGTFSSSLNLLPRAGMWMIEVKKLFGLMLISMCFYYISNIAPWYLVLLLAAGFLLVCGSFYIASIKKHDAKTLKRYKYLVGLILLISAGLSLFQAYKTTFISQEHTMHEAWLSDYELAITQALDNKTLLMIDFGAAWCSSCKAIERNLFGNAQVITALQKFTLVHIDCTNPQAEPCSSIQNKFSIIGFPTILLIDPQSGTILKKWGSELLDVSPEAFIKEVQEL